MALGDWLNPVLPDATSAIPAALGDPRLQAALISAGGALAQPMQFGQSPFAHLLSSIGAGGESVRTNEALDLKQQEAERRGSEAESKAALRESQGLLAESRAATAGERAAGAEGRLEVARGREERLRLQNRTSSIIKAQQLHQRAIAPLQKQNEMQALLGKPGVPVPSFRDWIRQNPGVLATLGVTAEDLGYPAEDMTDVGGGDTGAPQSNVPPDAPRDASKRPPGMYTTPKGPMYWSGTGWRANQ